jgi:lysophospholipase L1-like esterase
MILRKATVIETWDWPTEMKKVSKIFDGHEGVFIQFGDSLTLAVPNTIWARTGIGHTPEEAAFLKWAHAGENNEKDGWYLAATSTETKGRYSTTFSASIGCSAKYSLTGRRGLPPLRELIAAYDPQLAVYAIGASDIIRKTPVDEYIEHVERAISLLEKNGTVPILSTLAPFRDQHEEVLKANEALRKLAEQKKLPLLDLYAEMENRNKDIFEFLAEDGVHLTWTRPKGRPTEANFLKSGYSLRCYLTVRKGMEVKEKVFDVLSSPAKAAARPIARIIHGQRKNHETLSIEG